MLQYLKMCDLLIIQSDLLIIISCDHFSSGFILCIVMMMKERRGRTTSQKWVGETWTWNITFKLIALLCYLFLEKERKSPYLRKKNFKNNTWKLTAFSVHSYFLTLVCCQRNYFVLSKMNHCLFNIFKLFSKKKFFFKCFLEVFSFLLLTHDCFFLNCFPTSMNFHVFLTIVLCIFVSTNFASMSVTNMYTIIKCGSFSLHK